MKKVIVLAMLFGLITLNAYAAPFLVADAEVFDHYYVQVDDEPWQLFYEAPQGGIMVDLEPLTNGRHTIRVQVHPSGWFYNEFYIYKQAVERKSPNGSVYINSEQYRLRIPRGCAESYAKHFPGLRIENVFVDPDRP